MTNNYVNTYVMKTVTVDAILVSKDNIDNVIKFLGSSFVSVDQNKYCILFNQFGLKGVLTTSEYYLVRVNDTFHVSSAYSFNSTHDSVKQVIKMKLGDIDGITYEEKLLFVAELYTSVMWSN